MCACVCMCVCMCVCICVCLCVSVHLCVYVHVLVYACVSVRGFIYVYASLDPLLPGIVGHNYKSVHIGTPNNFFRIISGTRFHMLSDHQNYLHLHSSQTAYEIHINSLLIVFVLGNHQEFFARAAIRSLRSLLDS